MKKTIRLFVSHPEIPDGPIQGFRSFWAFYVNGFRPKVHCQACLKGKLATQFCSPTARSGESYELDAMDRYPYVYVCGVGSGTKDSLKNKNFHLPLQYSPGQVLTRVTYNGYEISAENAIALPIPALPLGWKGRDKETTQCKNFQFAADRFGYDEELAVS